MAWNESRVWMIAPGWWPSVESIAPSPQSSAIQLLSFFRSEINAPTIDVSELSHWLKARGLTPVEHDAFESSGVEASIEQSNGAVSSIRLTFTIYDPFRKRVLVKDHFSVWNRLVADLARAWGFQLVHPNSFVIASADDFQEILRATPACEGVVI